MTAALLANRLARDPQRRNWTVDSAGVFAYEGQPASVNAVLEMRERGIELGGHCSQPVDHRLMEAADLVLAMTRHHVEGLQQAFPDQAGKVRLLSEMVGRTYDIADPYGASRAAYSTAARDLAALIERGYERIVALAGVAPCAA
jgi:protein-tyrosine-phosphatase